MDFALLLVIATAVTGVLWAIDAVWLRHRRAVMATQPGSAPAGAPPREPVIIEYARSFFPILLVVLLIRSFLFEPFRIPSASMMPTLLIGDFIFVSKFAYGLRLPVLNSKILELGTPRRGDVVVFRLPSEPSTNYIKRLVGLPGDAVTYLNDQIWVNGSPVPIETVGRYRTPDMPVGAILARERLGGVTHDVLLMPDRSSMQGTFIVPEGQFFMMGDNRDNSQDSRYAMVGFVPEANIVGKAVRIWMNWDFPGTPIWSRIGDPIR